MNTYSKYCPNVWVAKCSEKHEKDDVITVTTKYGKENECLVWNFLLEKDGFYYYSITGADGFNRQERARMKSERYKEWADKAMEKADIAFEKSGNAVKDIPFGQPILVGHHSEGAHRNAIKRSWEAIGRCHDELEKAKSHDSKAEYWDKMSEKIDLSMPESIEYYAAKLKQAKEYHDGLKSGKYQKTHSYSVVYANKAVRDAERNLELAEKLWGDRD